MTATHTDSPIRAGAFDNPDDVAAAIVDLRRAGFLASEIKVVAADQEVVHRFAEYVDQQPAGAGTSKALSRAAVLYVALTAVGLLVGLFSSPTTTLIVVSALLGVALLATFGSAMMTRGAERELADYYSEGAIPGQVLLAVELPENPPAGKIAAADRVFERFTGTHAALDRE